MENKISELNVYVSRAPACLAAYLPRGETTRLGWDEPGWDGVGWGGDGPWGWGEFEIKPVLE